MEKIKLLKGLFKTSQNKGKEYLLSLDADRLIAPCYEAIGKSPKKKRYGGWEAKEISGHSLGHYLSALAAMYTSDGDIKIKEKLNYIISELEYIQSFSEDGYLSGFKKDCFNKVFSKNFNVTAFELGDSWVPWYSIHKIYNGLIDAYKLTDNKKALEIVIKMADWAKKGTDNLNEEEFNKMLKCEHGGMCEVMAILYEITKNEDYLTLAIRFYHKEILKDLEKEQDKLEGKHANTQIPKILGAAKLYEITGQLKYKIAAEFFWNTVIKNRSYVIGGNSINEHFEEKGKERLGVTTAETCNTYNMLKLTEYLYSWNHNGKYMDYYEKALYNHILASQDPHSAMKTYFVSTKPGHFKVYCTPENSFWCCTGTGMENPGRYIRQIYYRELDELFINLYISSEIILEDKNIKVRQETSFPESNTSKLIFEEGKEEQLTIKIRIPKWISNKAAIKVNDNEIFSTIKDGYIEIKRKWNKGDVIEIKLPMDIHVYNARDNENKIVFMYGPIVLAGKLGKENFPESDIIDDQLKFNHYPGIVVPKLVTDTKKIETCLKPIKGKILMFEFEGIIENKKVKCILVPFYNIHHERYTIYWDKMTTKEYETNNLNQFNYQEKLDSITIDSVSPSEQQSEIEHKMLNENSNADYSSEAGKGWRQASNEGYFTYEMKVDTSKEAYLAVQYWGNDREYSINEKRYLREFSILVNNKLLVEERLTDMLEGKLFYKFYPIPKDLLEDNEKLKIKFAAEKEKITGRIFDVRITTNNNFYES